MLETGIVTAAQPLQYSKVNSKAEPSLMAQKADVEQTNSNQRNNYTLRYDPYFHMETGAHDLFALHQFVENEGISPAAESLGLKETRGGRALEFFPFTLIWSLYIGGLQHEIFGHGARNRENGCSTNHDVRFWQIKWGQAMSSDNCSDRSWLEEGLDSAGGIESTQVMSKIIAQQTAIGQGKYHSAWLYIDTKLDTTDYILANSPSNRRGIFYPNLRGFNYLNYEYDIEAYWFEMSYARLNELVDQYGIKKVHDYNLWNGPNFSYRAIEAGAAWNMLDPTVWYSGYQVYDYIDTGKETFKPPSFLPRTNFILTTRGPDFYFRLPFMTDGSTLFDPYIRTTANYSENNYGAGLEVKNISLGAPFGTKFTADAEAHGWYKDGWKGGFGGGVGAGISGQFHESFSLGGGGYFKTKGPLMGKINDKGFQWYLQVGTNF
jgi:hypothetical protein